MKAVFLRVFHWRDPKTKVGFGAQKSEEPQTMPRAFIEAALAAGAAVEVPKKRQTKD